MREGAVTPVGEHLLGLGVAAVLLLGLEHHERRIGEDGVVAPGGEQLILAPGIEVFDAADDQAGGDRLARARGERGVFHLRDLGAGDPAAELVIPDGAGGSGWASRRPRRWRRSRRGPWGPGAR